MAGKVSPITPSVLEWAVAEDGRTTQQIADAAKVDVATLDEWMHGESKPTVGQVTLLADRLRRPRSMFFLPAPPQAATLPARFRHPPGDSRQVSTASRRRVRQARQIQSVLTDALAASDPVEVPRFVVGHSTPDAAAAKVRDWLGVTDAEQESWRDDYEGMNRWRAAIESRGIFVFALEIGEPAQRNRPRLAGTDGAPDVRGFSAWDNHAPMIVMNSRRVNPAARSFTLGHELGHLVAREDAACIDTAIGPEFPEPVERWCEEFGAALLMPRPAVNLWAQRRRLSPESATLEDVTAMMRRFRASARACALRVIDLGYAARSLYAAVLSAFRPVEPLPDAKKKEGSDPRSVLRLRQFGPRALETVFRDVAPIEALSILRITVPDARELAAQVPSAAGI